MSRALAFIGSHGSGKTTLAKETKTILEGLGYSTFLTPENAPRCPHPINEAGNINSQRWIYENFKKLESEAFYSHADYLIFDRCKLDHIPYTMYLERTGRISKYDSEALTLETIGHWRKCYFWQPTLYYCAPLPLVNNGIRSVNPEFQAEIDRLYRRLLGELNIQYLEVER